MNPTPTTGSTNHSQTVKINAHESKLQKEVCDGYIASGLTWNVTIKFLMDNLMKMGCKPPPRFIQCIDCGNTKAGGGFGILEETISNLHSNESSSSHHPQACDPKNLHQTRTDTYTKKLVPEIFLCQQHLVNEQHAHESLIHELIHAIDLCRYDLILYF